MTLQDYIILTPDWAVTLFWLVQWPLALCFRVWVSPVECLRTLSEPLSREPFRSPSDRDDLISLCLSLLFTCRYCRGESTRGEKKCYKCRKKTRPGEEMRKVLHHCPVMSSHHWGSCLETEALTSFNDCGFLRQWLHVIKFPLTFSKWLSLSWYQHSCYGCYLHNDTSPPSDRTNLFC